MDDKSHNQIIRFYKKRIEPFVAIFVLAFLITACFLVWQDNKMKKEISENCGWETEKYQCYCDKPTIDKIKIEMNGGGNFNVSLDG